MSGWTETEEQTLRDRVGRRDFVSYEMAEQIADEMDRPVRSITGKLRALDYDVAKKNTEVVHTFTEAETESLASFVEANSGKFTYADLADQFGDGSYTAKQLQGKILHMKLTDHVKPTVKVEYTSRYTDEQTNNIVAQANRGDTLESITENLGGDFTLNSVRGKCLSLLKQGIIQAVPKQSTSNAKVAAKAGYFDALDATVAELTVAQIAEQLGKTPRGVKVALTRNGLSCADYESKSKSA